MAPNGPRKGAGPSGARNPRGSTGNGLKSVTRGGVSKRRSNVAGRIDRDGDLDMDAPVNGRGSRKPKRDDSIPTAPRSVRQATNGPRGPRPTAKAQQIIQRVITGTGGNITSRLANGMSGGPKAFKAGRQINAPHTMTLRVEGLKSSKAANNEGGGLKELLNFLERKAQSVAKTARPIRIKKSQIKGDFVYITTSKEDGEDILKLNGFSFAGTAISITEATPAERESGLSSDALEIKDNLRDVLSARYDVNAKLLNLSTLGDDPVLHQIGFFSGGSKPEKLFRALMAVCEGLFKSPQEKRNAVVSVSLAGNNVDDVFQIMALADTFPDLVNLDLSRNHFKDLKGVLKWRHRLQKLETLLLNDNPIEVATPDYKAELVTWFPRLQNLSGLQVRTPEQVAAALAALRPTPIPHHGADFRDIAGVGEGFIKEFIRMYDVDRNSLAAMYYDEQSTFSLAVDNTFLHSSNTPRPQSSAYIKFSRNHTKITHTGPRIQRLFTGTNFIQSVWQQLPPTRHPDLATDFNKYIIDCHPVQGLQDPSGQSPAGMDGIIITIHGEFQDQEPVSLNTTTRSFSRTFVLGPGVPGRNPIRVISDMLSLRSFAPLPTSTPGPTAQSNEELQKQQMIIELCKQSGMTPEYSRFCLVEANWVFQQALVLFNEKRAILPAAAFATQ